MIIRLIQKIFVFFFLELQCRWNCDAWHAYSNERSSKTVNDSYCSQYDSGTLPRLLNPLYKLWPGLADRNDLHTGEILYGFEEAMDIIWRHQHPVDCANAKFLISNGWPGGFGSVAHVEGQTLAIAMQLGRVLLPHPDGPVRGPPRDLGWSYSQAWHVDNSYCRRKSGKNATTMDCYFEPWSSCSIEDALRGKSLESIPDLWVREYEAGEMTRYGGMPARIRKMSAKFRTMLFVNIGHGLSFIPSVFRPILSCSRMIERFEYYWWRAVSASYMVRPNQETLDEIQKYSTLPLAEDEVCVAMHVRYGDKGIEMKLVELEAYLNATEYLWANRLLPTLPVRQKPVLFLGSDEPSVFGRVSTWGEARGWRVLYTTLFDRNSVSAKLEFNALLELQFKQQVVHHDLEYMSILVNLQYALRCDAWVCTLGSNTCRLIDEMRASVGVKANRHYADLSAETCSAPPCIGGDILSFGW